MIGAAGSRAVGGAPAAGFDVTEGIQIEGADPVQLERLHAGGAMSRLKDHVESLQGAIQAKRRPPAPQSELKPPLARGSRTKVPKPQSVEILPGDIARHGRLQQNALGQERNP